MPHSTQSWLGLNFNHKPKPSLFISSYTTKLDQIQLNLAIPKKNLIDNYQTTELVTCFLSFQRVHDLVIFQCISRHRQNCCTSNLTTQCQTLTFSEQQQEQLRRLYPTSPEGRAWTENKRPISLPL